MSIVNSKREMMEEDSQFGVSNSSCRAQSSVHSPSHHTSIPTSRNRKTPWLRHCTFSSTQILVLIFLTCCISISSATYYIEEEMVEASIDVSKDFGSTLERLARSGTILVDQSPPPKAADWTLATVADDLQRRADPLGSGSQDESSSTSSSKIITSTVKSASSSTLAPTTTSSGIAVTATTSASPLPSPFDNGFNANLTSNCAAFMSSMLANSTFKSCLPFSLLLQNSNSFFQASKSVLRITQTLDATCAANVTQCSALMTSFASNITSGSACASDISTQNPLIQQAQLGLQAYTPLYTASCLRNPNTSSYCFADAVTNSSSPTDSYIFYLPLNISLPGGSQPTCDKCLQDTMAVFGAASGDRKSALASDYVTAAMQVNVQCGPNFVNQSLAAPASSLAGALTPSSIVGLFTLAMVVASWLL